MKSPEVKLCLRKLILLLFLVKSLHCISLLKKATLKFAVFCCSATLMWRRKTKSNYPPLLLLLFLWSETLFAQVDSFAFLQSMHSTAWVCWPRPRWSLPSFAAVQRWCAGEGHRVVTPPYYYYYCFCEVKLCLRKLILLLFFSQWAPLHWSAWHGDLEVCRLLLQCNADVEAKDVE